MVFVSRYFFCLPHIRLCRLRLVQTPQITIGVTGIHKSKSLLLEVNYATCEVRSLTFLMGFLNTVTRAWL